MCTKGKEALVGHCYSQVCVFALLSHGVRVRDWIKEGKKKDQKKIKGTTKPLMANLDRTPQSTKWVSVGLPSAKLLPTSPLTLASNTSKDSGL